MVNMVLKTVLSIIFILAIYNTSEGFEIRLNSNLQADNVGMFINKNSFGLSKNVRDNFVVSGEIFGAPYSIGSQYVGVREVSGFYSQADLSFLYNISNVYFGGGISGNDFLRGGDNFNIGFSIIAAYGVIFNSERSVFVVKPYFNRSRVTNTPMAIEYNVMSTKPGVNIEFRHSETFRIEADFSVAGVEVNSRESLLEDSLHMWSYDEGNRITSFYTIFQLLKIWNVLNSGVSFVYSNSQHTFNQIVGQQLSTGSLTGIEYNYAYIPIHTPNDNVSVNFHLSNEPLKGFAFSAKVPLWSRYIRQMREFQEVSETVTNTAEIELKANYERNITDVIVVAINARVSNKPYVSFAYFSGDSYTSLSAGLGLRLRF